MSDSKQFKAYAVPKAGAPVEDFSYAPAPLGDDQVEVQIECCGVCHSDLHQACNDWGGANYPLVPGHEIIGKITALGKNVKHLKEGQRVGLGPQTGHCGSCQECKRGELQLCPKMDQAYNTPTGHSSQPYAFGGFAEYTRHRADWAFPIPDALPSIQAAPLLCAGLTTWSPFVHHKIGKGHKVGIVGIGGLGHLAVQFAAKLGCDVTAISTSSSKKDYAHKLGAQHFLDTSDNKALEAASSSLDFILSTVSANEAEWDPLLQLLRPDGQLVMVGLPQVVKFNPMNLVAKRLNWSGSILCNHKDITDMLEFCAKHNIVAQTEQLPMSAENANEAFKRVHDNNVKFRMVLTNDHK